MPFKRITQQYNINVSIFNWIVHTAFCPPHSRSIVLLASHLSHRTASPMLCSPFHTYFKIADNNVDHVMSRVTKYSFGFSSQSAFYTHLHGTTENFWHSTAIGESVWIIDCHLNDTRFLQYRFGKFIMSTWILFAFYCFFIAARGNDIHLNESPDIFIECNILNEIFQNLLFYFVIPIRFLDHIWQIELSSDTLWKFRLELYFRRIFIKWKLVIESEF